MATITVPKPGSDYLCKGKCNHADCEGHRKNAAAICRVCDKKIGYGKPWVVLAGGQSAHFNCAEDDGRIHSVSSRFSYPYKTTIPTEIGKRWVDRSWSNDSSACCWLRIPSKQHPKAVLCLWVQPDDKSEWEFPDQGKFQLDFIVDENEGWDNNTCKTLLTSDGIVTVMTEVKKHMESH